MKITILEKSFKLKKREKERVIRYFSNFGEVEYIDRENTQKGIDADVIIYADGGWGGIRFKEYRIKRRPNYAIGFSDATYFLNYMIFHYQIPVFYGLNAVDFLRRVVIKKYPNIFEYCERALRNKRRATFETIGGNLTVFNFFLMGLEERERLRWLKGKRIFIEDGGFNVIKGDGTFLLDIELERMRHILNSELYHIFSGVLFGGIQEDDYTKNDYLTYKEVFNKHFHGLIIKRVRCSHSEDYVNDLILMGDNTQNSRV